MLSLGLQQLGGQRFSWPASSCCSSAPQHEVRPPKIDAPYVLERFCMQHPAKSAQSKSDLREFAGNFRVWFEARFELQAVANFTGICCLRSTPASSCCSATSCTFLRPFSPPFVVQTGGVVLEECPSTFPHSLLLVSNANSLPAAMICCALQGWLGVHRTRPDRRRARGACAEYYYLMKSHTWVSFLSNSFPYQYYCSSKELGKIGWCVIVVCVTKD